MDLIEELASEVAEMLADLTEDVVEVSIEAVEGMQFGIKAAYNKIYKKKNFCKILMRLQPTVFSSNLT